METRWAPSLPFTFNVYSHFKERLYIVAFGGFSQQIFIGLIVINLAYWQILQLTWQIINCFTAVLF